MEKIKISGVEGDKVNLHINGFIFTKYGDICLIKSVDVEKRDIHTYLYGTFDFSRVSGSVKRSDKSTLASCLESIKHQCHRYTRIGSVINNGEATITDIIYPDFKEKFDISIITTKETITITDVTQLFDIYKTITFVPKTKRELLSEMLNAHSSFNGLKNEEALLDKIEKLYE